MHVKQCFLFLSLLCALFSRSLAQTTPVYFDSSSFWGYSQAFNSSNFPGGCTHQISNYWNIEGDSTVLGYTWYKLYSTGRYQLDCTYPTSHSDAKHAHRYVGLLRQAGKQVHMVFPSTAADTVIYNFDLQTGDHFFADTATQLQAANTVAAITPFPGDTTRSVFTSQSLAPEWGNAWVEGIGALRGDIFGPKMISCYSFSCASIGQLTCYSMQGHDFGFSECTAARQQYQAIALAVTATKPGPADAPEVWLSPNPGHDYLDLHVSGMTVRDVRVINCSGQVVHRRSDFTMTGDEIFSLPVGQLPAGLYQVWVYGENRAVALKWMKI